MKKVAGRNAEKKILDELLSSNKAEFVALYGRRRIGKTFLIRQYLSKHIVLDFAGSNNESTTTQLVNFKRVFSEQCFELESTPENWSEAFKHINDYLLSIQKDQKLVVFLDELPWLDRPKSGFLLALEFFLESVRFSNRPIASYSLWFRSLLDDKKYCLCKGRPL